MSADHRPTKIREYCFWCRNSVGVRRNLKKPIQDWLARSDRNSHSVVSSRDRSGWDSIEFEFDDRSLIV